MSTSPMPDALNKGDGAERQATIVKTEEGRAAFVRRYAWMEHGGEYEVGSLLTLSNGEKWLHPYNGRAPFRVWS